MATELEKQAEMNEKLQALEAARLQIEKQFGKGSIMKLGTQTDAAHPVYRNGRDQGASHSGTQSGGRKHFRHGDGDHPGAGCHKAGERTAGVSGPVLIPF